MGICSLEDDEQLSGTVRIAARKNTGGTGRVTHTATPSRMRFADLERVREPGIRTTGTTSMNRSEIRNSPGLMVSHEGSAFATGATVRSPTNSLELRNPPAQWFSEMSPGSWRNLVPPRRQRAGNLQGIRFLGSGTAPFALPSLAPAIAGHPLFARRAEGRSGNYWLSKGDRP